MLEIETPANKDDIVRFMDNYGREGKKYIADLKKLKLKIKLYSKILSLVKQNLIFLTVLS